MYEYKKKQWLLTECLEEMYWLWYRLAYYDKELQISVWDKKISRTITKSIWEKDEQWLEFRNLYKQIKDSGLSNNALIVKYNTLCKEWLHSKIMDNLKDYKIYLEVTKKKDYALMAQTYINQARYNDTWEIVQDQSRKFINDIFKELELNADEIENVKTEIQAYEKKHNKEVTDYNVRSLIHYVRTGSPL